MKTLKALILVILFISPLSVLAQTVSVQRAKIVEYGLYDIGSNTTTHVEEHTQSGTATKVRKITFKKQTKNVPGTIGTSFGFRYLVKGKPKGQKINLKIINIFPAPGMTNPKTGKNFKIEKLVFTHTIGTMPFATYTFDNDWEIIHGDWTMQVWYNEQKLLEITFMVKKP